MIKDTMTKDEYEQYLKEFLKTATDKFIEDYDNYLNDTGDVKLYQKAIVSYRDVVRGANFICSQIRKEKREK